MSLSQKVEKRYDNEVRLLRSVICKVVVYRIDRSNCMSEVETPTQPAYYYECSYGRFRLTYFIPLEELRRLVAAGEIKASVVEDFPDGVDLDCTEPDFNDFRDTYEYRPSFDAVQLCNAFLAIYSTTDQWKSNHCTGFVMASVVEKNLESIREKLREKSLLPGVDEASIESAPTLQARRELLVANALKDQKAQDVLIEMNVDSVASEMPIQSQDFNFIPMTKGIPIQEIFERLHRNEHGNRGQLGEQQ